MRKKVLVLVIALFILSICISGISTYFTDRTIGESVYMVGKIDVEIVDSVPVSSKNMSPGERVERHTAIKNIGTDDVYVFMEVSVPYADVTISDDLGFNSDYEDLVLFTFTPNANWKQVGKAEKDAVKKVYTHTYAYAVGDEMIPLPAGVTTESLLDSVAFANIVNAKQLQSKTLEIMFDCYAIQSAHVEGTIEEIYQQARF